MQISYARRSLQATAYPAPVRHLGYSSWRLAVPARCTLPIPDTKRYAIRQARPLSLS